ncbi:MAG: PKD domain-containing protein, partial [Methanomicrobiales archaeon]|nr:PKD domain-containing protein [Methanomicrobiales archaeon]
DSDTRIDYITVLDPPVAAFTADSTEGNAPLSVQFTDESAGNVTAWLWNFGDGNTSTEQSPSHTYETPGIYNVSLNASNAYGFSIETESDYITVLDPPAAAFTADQTEGNAPLTVQFADESAGDVTAWLWDFGDGNTSTEQSPSHTYGNPGNYTVSLTACNDYGEDTDTRTDYITVLEPPVAVFTADPTEGNSPLAVQFTDESAGNVTAWLWDFGDGNTSIEPSPNHTYEDAGAYTVTLNASNAYGFSIETRVNCLTVLEPPAAAFTADPTEGNAPLTVLFNDESAGDVTAWLWDFGDGNTSTEQSPSHTYENPGDYNVSLTASNDYGEDSDTRIDYITVLDPPVAAFTADPTEGNAPLVIQFTDESAGNVTAWLWNFGDGNTSTEQSPNHTYVTADTYTVSLNASNAYGFSIETKTENVIVLEPPVAAFTADPTEGNAPLTVQFTDESAGNVTAWFWDFGDNTTTDEQYPTHTYATPGNYTVSLNASNAYGFSIETKTENVIVLDPPAAAFTADPTEGNAPLTVQFNDESTGDVTNWFWDFGDNTTTDEQHPAHTYATPGNYTVSLNASNAYGFSIETKVDYLTVLDPPAATFTADPTAGTAPLTVAFTDESTGNVTAWLWFFGDGTSSTEQNPTHTYTTAGAYTISLNVSNAYGFSVKTKTDYISVAEPVPPEEPAGSLTVTSVPAGAAIWLDGTDTNAVTNSTLASITAGEHTITLKLDGYREASEKVVVEANETTEVHFILVGVAEPPVAAFTVNTTAGTAPLTVAFTDTSAGDPVEWAWDFGDNTTSTDQHPVHTYENPGNYTVNLTATNAAGSSTETRTDYIMAVEHQVAVADFTADRTSGNAPLVVRFTDKSAGKPIAWQWDFGDGRKAATKNPIITYNEPGTYSVSLDVTYSDRSTIPVTKTNYITVGRPDPVASFITDKTEGGADLTVRFTDTSTWSPDNYFWEFGDGKISTARNPEHTYTTAGIHTVNLSVGRVGSPLISSSTKQIIVKPVADFTANVTREHAPLAVQFTSTSTGHPATYSWEFGDGNTSTGQNPNHTYDVPGTYSVSLSVTGGGLTHTETKTKYITAVKPDDPPAAEFRANTTDGYAPLTVQFFDQSGGGVDARQWDFGDGNTSTGQNPIHTYTAPGTYAVRLTASKGSQSDSITKTAYITVTDPGPTAVFTASKVRGESPLAVQFIDASTGAPPLTWTWDFGDGTASSLRNPIHVFNYTDDGAKTYMVTLTVENAHGQKTSNPTEITVVSPPQKEDVRDRINTTTAIAGETVPLEYQGFKLEIPKNTTAKHDEKAIEELEVGVAPDLTEPPSGTIIMAGGKAFKLGPEGAQFDPEIPVTITFTPEEWNELFGDGRTTKLQKYDNRTGKWIELNNQTSDAATRTLTGYTNSFSVFAPITTEFTSTPTPPRSSSGGTGPSYTTYTGAGILKVNTAGTVLQSIKVNAEDTIGSTFISIGTNALDADNKPLDRITLTPLAGDDMPAVPSGSSFRFAGYVYEAGPDGATFDPAITLTLDIPEDAWDALDAGSNTLTVKWYSDETGEWEDVPTTVYKSTRSVDAKVTHFSTFALFTEPVATPTGTETPETPAIPATPPVEEHPAEGFPMTAVLAIFAVLIIVIAAGYFFMMRK